MKTTTEIRDWHGMKDVEVTTIHPGRQVFCDDCNADYTERKESGGILFQSKAICPTCAPKWLANAFKYGEQGFIRGECPDGMPFADWVRECLR
jgi:hypothetical protein